MRSTHRSIAASASLLLAAAYLAGLQLALFRARRAGLDANKVLDLGIWVIVSALVGAKLLLVVIDFRYFVEHPGEIFSVARSAGSRPSTSSTVRFSTRCPSSDTRR